MNKNLEKNNETPTDIFAQESTTLGNVFSNKNFGVIDSNLAAWLPEKISATNSAQVDSYQLTEPLNNQELVDAVGGLETIKAKHLFSPTQIKDLVVRGNVLQKNGYQNLFFVSNPGTGEVYLLGVVYDESVERWVPYIYRLRNLYRAWSRGNRLFLMS